MNRSFNIVWSAARNMFVVAPEFASSNGRLLSHTRINALAASLLCVSGGALAEDRTFTTNNSGEYKLSGTYLSSNNDPNSKGTTAISAWGWGDQNIVISDEGIVTIKTSGAGTNGIYIDGANSSLTLDNQGWSILTADNSSSAVTATSGARISLTGGSIATQGDNSFGVSSSDANSIATLNDVTITTAGEWAGGLIAYNGGKIVMTRGSIITEGYLATSVLASSSESVIDLNNVSVSSAGDWSTALSANEDAHITMTGGSVATIGIYSDGVTSYNNSVVTLKDTSVSTSGGNSDSISAIFGGTVNVTGGNITTTGNSAHGAYSGDVNSAITLDNVKISTAGEWSYGLLSRGNIIMSNSSILTTGSSAYGIGNDSGALMQLSNLIISTQGYGARGLSTDKGNTILKDSQVTTAGDYAPGIVSSEAGIVLDNIGISTHGQYAYGVDVYATKQTTVSNSHLKTTGSEANGILAFSAKVILDNVDISTSGTNAEGISAKTDSSITMTGGSIQTTGAGSSGINIYSSDLQLNQVSISTQGEDAYGLKLGSGSTLTGQNLNVISNKSWGVLQEKEWNSASASLINSQITGDSAAYYLDSSYAYYDDELNSLNVTGGSVTATAKDGSAFYVNAGAADITVDNLQNVSAANLLTVSDNNWNNVIFRAQNHSTLSGAIQAGNSNVTVDLDKTSLWNVHGNSAIGNLTNAGVINLNTASGSLNAGQLMLTDSSVLNVHLGSAASEPTITTGHSNLNGALNISGIGNIKDSLITTPYTFTLISAENKIQGDFNHFTVAGIDAKKTDFLTLDGRINPDNKTQYELVTSLSWYADKNNAATEAHGTFTLSEADGQFTVNSRLDDVENTLASTNSSGWDGKSLTKLGNGTLILSAANTYSGDTNVKEGSLWLENSGTIGTIGSKQKINIASGASFGGSGIVNGHVFNGGNITMSKNGETGRTLTINGNYTGNNGNLFFNTQLGGDDSLTDKLTISGDSNGNSTVYITNVNGKGEKTNKGIELIDIAGKSNGVFTQGNQVQIGLYEYRLYKDAGDWYLRSQSNTPVDPVKPDDGNNGNVDPVNPDDGNNGNVDPVNPDDGNNGNVDPVNPDDGNNGNVDPVNPDDGNNGNVDPVNPDDGNNGNVDPVNPDDGNNGNVDPVDPDDGSNGNTTPPGSHQYRADIGAYLGNQWMVRNLQMQTLYDRQGSQLRTDNGNMWMRFKAGRSDSKAVTGNIDINNNYSQIQIGGDILTWDNSEQSLVTGIMASYLNADTDSTGNRGLDGSKLSASGNVSGYNLGIYLTWFADARTHGGLYIDSWYQYGMYSNTVKNGDVGSTDYDSHTHTASLEAGYRYDIALKNGNQISLTPQAQITWQKYSADTIIDQGRTRIDGQNSDNWTTRLGLRVDGKLYKNQDSVIQPFAEINLLHTNDDVSVAFNNADVQMDLPANRAELKAGIEVNLNNQWSITGLVAGQKGSNNYGDLNGSLNVQYSW
ncbi:autotransporter outer membrane beta-barrel domain-containing protein [Klebsiella huaxiensis]|uniref:Autotransporter outer membrane beta-barrel domain-containing protein n=1 Tax=Klebsiella huaxiensis TaxID=2153354 RepID=A0ABT6EAA6_9ENTR|nr:autotransporter outer membrane beta-barrel domain-containing protein [Klebsiella huaxiensis]MDG1642325.1 autotransporter outer membrane beta-barrel domain-containing protein [Klebsiella huaxiensis]QBG09145.1 autotransporter outer membrane beta-barrel domain-containing protein [Klebsiella huaxiensis]